MATALRSRPWRSREDTRRMQAMASAHLLRDWPASRFHPGDLDWWAVQGSGRVPGIQERVRLWFAGPGDRPDDDHGDVVAFGWFGLPGEVDFLAASDDAAAVDPLVAEVVAWADERRATLATAEPAPLKVWAAIEETAASSLASLGLRPDETLGFVQFTGDLDVIDAWGPLALPDGLTLRPLTDADVPARVVCGHAAFPGSTMTVERYRTTFDAWLYRPDLDLVILDRDGRVVAFTIAWLDPVSSVVELEPVGVHPERQREGLGRELCREAFRRARHLGATRAVIGSEVDNAAATRLYESLGLRVTTHIRPFARPLAATAAGHAAAESDADAEDELAAEAAA